MQRVLRGAVFYFTLKFLCVSLQNGGHAGCIISIEQNVFVCIILEGSSLLCAVRTGYGVGESRAIKGVSKVYADTAHGAGAGAVFLQVEDHGSVHIFGVYALLFGVILQCFLITLSVYDVSSFPLAYDGSVFSLGGGSILCCSGRLVCGANNCAGFRFAGLCVLLAATYESNSRNCQQIGRAHV